MTEKTRYSTATASDAGKRLDVVAAAHFGVSRSSLVKSFADGRVQLNGAEVKPRVTVSAGDRLSLAKQYAVRANVDAPALRLVYSDEDLTIIDKPAGLLVHATEHGGTEPTVSDFSASISKDEEDLGRPGIVHRLDRDTSGLLIVAKTTAAKRYLQQQFRDRKVYKSYIVLVRGRLNDPQATINLPIGRDRKRPTRRAVVPGGRTALTRYQVLAEYPGASLVDAILETGRTHQIRVHFAHLGHPVVGDRLYGQPQPGLKRQFLHAAHVRLVGPHGQPIDVRSQIPADLRDYLGTLGEIPKGV